MTEEAIIDESSVKATGKAASEKDGSKSSNNSNDDTGKEVKMPSKVYIENIHFRHIECNRLKFFCK